MLMPTTTPTPSEPVSTPASKQASKQAAKPAQRQAPQQAPRKPAPAQAGALFVGQSATSSTHAEPTEADFVTDMFDLLARMHPAIQTDRLELERAVRQHYGGARRYVATRPDPGTTAARVLALFNGRNARTVARVLGISRMQVYRHLKQPGSKK